MSGHLEVRIKTEEEEMTKIGTYKPDGATLAQFTEIEQEHLDWLSARICKNCKWWDSMSIDPLDEGVCFPCINQSILRCMGALNCGGIFVRFSPPEDFGCNQWESK